MKKNIDPVCPNPLIDEFFVDQLLIQGSGQTRTRSEKPTCTTLTELRKKLRRHLIHNIMGFPVGFRSTNYVFIFPGVTSYVIHQRGGERLLRSIAHKSNSVFAYNKLVRLRKIRAVGPLGRDLEPYFLPSKHSKSKKKLESTFKGFYINDRFDVTNFSRFIFQMSDPTIEHRTFIRTICQNSWHARNFVPQSGVEPASTDTSDQPAQSGSDIQKPELAEGNPQVPTTAGSQSQSVCSGFKGTTLPPNFCRGAYFISQSK
jgi:hypothetical protein